LWRNGKAIDLDSDRRFSPIVLNQIQGRKTDKTRSCAYAVNTAGQVVGITLRPSYFDKDPRLYSLLSGTASGIDRAVAFLWQDGVMYDLNCLIDSEWFLQVAWDINSSGQIIAVGQHKGLVTRWVFVDQRRGAKWNLPLEARYQEMEGFKKGYGSFAFVLEPTSKLAKNGKKALLIPSSASAGKKK